MAQRIIMVHGRSTKPAKARYSALQRLALLQGLRRVSPAKAAKIEAGEVEVDYVYYGDVNNRILNDSSKMHAGQLTETDPHCDNGPCVTDAGYADAIAALGKIRRFDKAAYRKVLKANDDLAMIDDVTRAVSTLAAITSATFLNEVAIKIATADMGAYLLRRAIGSKVRERLQTPLKRALKRGDDICLVSHSMGCMVAYDVLWKFSRMSEYGDVRENGNRVSQWLTLGCPLGEAGVKANLYDANERRHKDGTDKHPRHIVGHWNNIAAVDDFICHDATMRGDFADMLKFAYVDGITDKRIYNCYAKDGKANAHKFYGYLVHPVVAAQIANWIA